MKSYYTPDNNKRYSIDDIRTDGFYINVTRFDSDVLWIDDYYYRPKRYNFFHKLRDLLKFGQIYPNLYSVLIFRRDAIDDKLNIYHLEYHKQDLMDIIRDLNKHYCGDHPVYLRNLDNYKLTSTYREHGYDSSPITRIDLEKDQSKYITVSDETYSHIFSKHIDVILHESKIVFGQSIPIRKYYKFISEEIGYIPENFTYQNHNESEKRLTSTERQYYYKSEKTSLKSPPFRTLNSKIMKIILIIAGTLCLILFFVLSVHIDLDHDTLAFIGDCLIGSAALFFYFQSGNVKRDL